MIASPAERTYSVCAGGRRAAVVVVGRGTNGLFTAGAGRTTGGLGGASERCAVGVFAVLGSGAFGANPWVFARETVAGCGGYDDDAKGVALRWTTVAGCGGSAPTCRDPGDWLRRVMLAAPDREARIIGSCETGPKFCAAQLASDSDGGRSTHKGRERACVRGTPSPQGAGL